MNITSISVAPPPPSLPHQAGSPSNQLPFAPTSIFLRGTVHEREINVFLANKVWTTDSPPLPIFQKGITQQPLVRLTRFSKRLKGQDTCFQMVS
jgi:hypothetical protein